MASQLRVHDGSASLYVSVGKQSFIVDISHYKRSWLWSVDREDTTCTSPVIVGCWRAHETENLSEGRAKTWAEAYRAGLRACEKLALKEASERKRKKAKAKSKK